MTGVQAAVHFGDGPSIDLYTDAELTSGEALSWGLMLAFQDSSWIIESEVRRNHQDGQDSVRQLPTRYAVTPETLSTELRAAGQMLVNVWSDGEPMFPGEGYGR